jgi:hypothetical protein
MQVFAIHNFIRATQQYLWWRLRVILANIRPTQKKLCAYKKITHFRPSVNEEEEKMFYNIATGVTQNRSRNLDDHGRRSQ